MVLCGVLSMMILNPVNIFIFKKGNLKKKRFLLPFYWNIYGSNNNVFIHIYIFQASLDIKDVFSHFHYRLVESLISHQPLTVSDPQLSTAFEQPVCSSQPSTAKYSSTARHHRLPESLVFTPSF